MEAEEADAAESVAAREGGRGEEDCDFFVELRGVFGGIDDGFDVW